MTVNDGDELASIFNDAFSNDRDSGGTSAPPALEQEQPAAEVVAEQPPEEALQTEPESKEVVQGRDEKTGRFVPVSVLIDERNKSKAEKENEARLRQEAETRANEYKAKVEAYERMLAKQSQPEPEPVPTQDEDPIGYLQHQMAALQNHIAGQHVLGSEARAIGVHGEEAVREAEQMAIRAGITNRVLAQRDPYETLMKWHSNVKRQQEIGPDLSAYRERIEKEAREKVLAEIRAQGMPSAQPGTAPQKFPASLASATAAGGDNSKETPESMFNGVFQRR